MPAVVACVQHPDRTIGGIHMTYLRLDGMGKAGVSKPKLRLGSCPGGAVRLAARCVMCSLPQGDGVLAVQSTPTKNFD